MSVEKIFHCTFCGHEVKAKTCPRKCSCCGQYRFFIDLSSYNQLESEFNNIKGKTKTTECNPGKTSKKGIRIGKKNVASIFLEDDDIDSRLSSSFMYGNRIDSIKQEQQKLINKIRNLEKEKSNLKTKEKKYKSLIFFVALRLIAWFV
ncbi:hypothetical protein [Limnospira platensis]|uniref:hypothetical protein n=1 Tax=Limnospira platensis TaxID=118562 RepID=UPI0002804057|nr:ADP-ribose pyrophosphatase [Arthrospira platensis C1]UWU51007.1 hypothetical protein APLC1_5964 [Arthrospira platensis C1]